MHKVWFVSLLLVHAAHAIPAQIVIIRHAEKLKQANPGPYLSHDGILRSLRLPAYFVNNFAVPRALFVPEIHGSSSIRPLQTIAPTASHFTSLYPEKLDNFIINSRYKKTDDLAQHILNEKAYDGETLIICWVHQDIQAIAEGLGVKNAPRWQGHDYSSVWIIDYNPDGTLKSFSINTQPSS